MVLKCGQTLFYRFWPSPVNEATTDEARLTPLRVREKPSEKKITCIPFNVERKPAWAYRRTYKEMSMYLPFRTTAPRAT